MAGPTVHAILNQDILYTVFEHLAAPDDAWSDYDGPAIPGMAHSPQQRDDAARRATLAWCTRVCRAFFDPAASVLWRELDDLAPILALDTVSVATHDSVDGPYSSLKRRQRYLSVIRAIRRPAGPSSIPPSLGEEVAPPLQLTKLRWIQEVPGKLDLLTLLSPSLRSLHIIFRHPRSWRRDRDQIITDRTCVETLLIRAAEQAPNLTYLRITRTSGIPESWLIPIRFFTRLEILDLLEPMYDAVSSSALLQPLSMLQHLHTLKMRLQQPTCPALGVEARAFLALRELHLNGKFAALQDATELLRAVASPHLRSVRIDDCECRTEAFVEAFHEFGVVLQTRFAATLEAVVLSVYGIGPPITLERPLVEYLHPLLQIRGLKDVRLSLAPKAVIVSASEADVRAMGDAWPLMVRLSLDCALARSKAGGGTRFSRRVLERMVQACPLLKDIQLPIDALEDSEVNTCSIGAYAGSSPYNLAEPFLCPCLCSA